MTNTALNCPEIVAQFSEEDIFAAVRNQLSQFPDYRQDFSDRDLFAFAYAKGHAVSMDAQMTRARTDGDYGRWEDGRILPCYMGSWFNVARKCPS